jgi:hypothetical protein
MMSPGNLTAAATLLLLATVATLARKVSPWRRWSGGFVIFAALTALAMSGTSAPHSVWWSVPVAGGATLASVFTASRDALRERPILSFIVSFGAGFCGLVAGLILAIEFGLLRP